MRHPLLRLEVEEVLFREVLRYGGKCSLSGGKGCLLCINDMSFKTT